tara:strand:+ start:85 stop:1404 length:1320 start_codon:yes stop_codon:yes gene_type:complete
MALIPVTDKFHVVDANVPTTNKGSATANAGRQAYTMQDIIDTVGSTGGSQPVFSGLSAQGIDNTTTFILSYGINIVSTSSGTNNAGKLPQPVTGQTVTVINNSANPITIFPSNVGGQINNLPIDSPIVVDNDNIPVILVCTVNPSPGQWSVINPPVPGAPLVYEWCIDTSTATGTNGAGIYNVGIPGPTQSAYFGTAGTTGPAGVNPQGAAGGAFGNATGAGGNDVVSGVPVLSNTAPPTAWTLSTGTPNTWRSAAPNPGIISNVKLETNMMWDDFYQAGAQSCAVGEQPWSFQLKRGWQASGPADGGDYGIYQVPLMWILNPNMGWYGGNPPLPDTPPSIGYYKLPADYPNAFVPTGYTGYGNPSQTLLANIGDQYTYCIDSIPFYSTSTAGNLGLNIGAGNTTTSGDVYYYIESGIATNPCINKKAYKFRLTIEFAS